MATFKNLFNPDVSPSDVPALTHEILTAHGMTHERFDQKSYGTSGVLYKGETGEAALKRFHPHLTSIGWDRKHHDADGFGRSLSNYSHPSNPGIRLQVVTLDTNYIGASLTGTKV
jgi:hypothetical protein